jgi:hypothetical protein
MMAHRSLSELTLRSTKTAAVVVTFLAATLFTLPAAHAQTFRTNRGDSSTASPTRRVGKIPGGLLVLSGFMAS